MLIEAEKKITETAIVTDQAKTASPLR